MWVNRFLVDVGKQIPFLHFKKKKFQVWFRFFFVLSTSVVAVLFVLSLRKFSLLDWSFEQKWVRLFTILIEVYTYLPLPIPTYLYQYLHIYTNSYLPIPIPTYLYQYLPTYTNTYLSIPISTYQYQYLPNTRCVVIACILLSMY